jgi:hypothetical protein
MSWTLRDAKREGRIINNIEKGEDRTAAILGASYLQDRLTDAIKARLVTDNEVHSKLFKGYGPLSSFGAKIDLAYLMKIVPRELRDKLHIIRDVRNRFAHRLDVNSFDDQPISDKCIKLLRPQTIKQMKEELEKNFSSDARGGDLAGVLFVYAPLAELPDTPRNGYMSTIKIMLMFIEIGTEFAMKDAGQPTTGLIVALPEVFQEVPE